MRNKRYVILILGLTLLLAGLVSGCGAPAPSTPAATPEARAVPEALVSTEELDTIREGCQAFSDSGRAKQSQIPPGMVRPLLQDLIYMEGQIIVTGPQAAVDNIADTLDLMPESEYSLNLTENHQELVIKLYQVDNSKVEQVTCEINELGNVKAKLGVFAEPNYHISPAPWTVGGSNWTQNGEWAIGVDGGGVGEASGTAFQTQWAFDATHIGLFDSGGGRLVKDKGEDVRVAIFDTSPFEGVEGWDEREFSYQGLTIPLTVFHPTLTPAPNCPGDDRYDLDKTLEGQNIRNHGLFVAGLVHTVAPSSTIYLIRVLEDDGCGSLSAVNENVQAFIDKTLQEEGTLEGTVINLSLGIHQPPDPTSLGLPSEATSLQSVLKAAVDQGAIVVAAAGNDSYASPRPTGMEIPAGYPFVIGVAASDLGRDRGCFSNAGPTTDMGQVAAPGGDGDDGKGTCNVPKCDASNPDACLVSVSLDSSTGYVYWVGTSFATPLVSGEAALLLGAGKSPSQVTSIITEDSCSSSDNSIPRGIINLPHALRGDDCP